MVVERDPDPGEEWDAFVESTPGATLGHAAAWARVLERAYALEPVYLGARDARGVLRGVLPMARFRGLRGARELVSLPFLDAAGILAPDPEVERALLDAALGIARESGARALELRQPRPLACLPATPAVHRVDLALRLEKAEETQWQALPGKARNQTRKATREGLRIAEDGPDLLAGFYSAFCANMRDLGSPVHARAFFAAARDAFGGRLRFVVARDAARDVGGLVAIHFAGAVTVPWASTLRSERSRCPNNLIYWEAIRWAVERGAAEFDFGRSPVGSGTHRFKLGWGAEERPLAWTRVDPTGAPLAIAAPSESPTLRRLARVWTRLPVPVTAWIGPRIRRHLSS